MVGRTLDAAVGGFSFHLSFQYFKKIGKKSVISALCHEPIDASRIGVARWKGWERDG